MCTRPCQLALIRNWGLEQESRENPVYIRMPGNPGYRCTQNGWHIWNNRRLTELYYARNVLYDTMKLHKTLIMGWHLVWKRNIFEILVLQQYLCSKPGLRNMFQSTLSSELLARAISVVPDMKLARMLNMIVMMRCNICIINPKFSKRKVGGCLFLLLKITQPLVSPHDQLKSFDKPKIYIIEWDNCKFY